jgi:hypothetical protein
VVHSDFLRIKPILTFIARSSLLFKQRDELS